MNLFGNHDSTINNYFYYLQSDLQYCLATDNIYLLRYLQTRSSQKVKIILIKLESRYGKVLIYDQIAPLTSWAKFLDK